MKSDLEGEEGRAETVGTHEGGETREEGKQSKEREEEEATTSDAPKPNLFVILVDDMGWNDMGYQSTDLSAMTPRMNALAEQGVKVRSFKIFLQQYNCSVLETWRYREHFTRELAGV